MKPFPLKGQVPPELEGLILDYVWDMEELHRLRTPVQRVPVTALEWQLDLPWWQYAGKVFSVTPRQVLADPVKYREQYERMLRADLRYPVIVREHEGRLVMMDGMHRLLKAAATQRATIALKVARNSP